jgi:UDP-N-acetylglucosamine 2-epimerase
VDHDARKIRLAIEHVLRANHSHLQRARTKSPYGKGRSSERIVRILRGIDLNKFWPKR